MSQDSFEYLALTFSAPEGPQEVNQALASYGGQGWRVVQMATVEQKLWFLLERPRPTQKE